MATKTTEIPIVTTPRERADRIREFEEFVSRLSSPAGIQAFLNTVSYSTHPVCHSPYRVMALGSAHCAEGAYFAAAALRHLGHRPLVIDLQAEQDDDHVIAPFRQDSRWGAVAKSNTTVLRYREPVYRCLRELVMSYFDFYFNIDGMKSLRGYSLPVSLARFDKRHWMVGDEDLEYIGDFLTGLPHRTVVTASEAVRLAPADPDLMHACFAFADPSGLFVPDRETAAGRAQADFEVSHRRHAG